MTDRPCLIAVAFLLGVLVGCQAPIRIQPGLSAVRVRLSAEPKSGRREPGSGAYPPSSEPLNVGAFERVDYRSLRDVVVWVEPAADPAHHTAAPDVLIEIGGQGEPPLYASGTGGTLRVRNLGAASERVYSISPGNEFDLGTLGVNGEANWKFASAGIVEIWSTRRTNAVATVFVAPTPWVRLARGGETVTFTDLPPGPCRVSCWHPRLPGASLTIELMPDQAASARLAVGVDSLRPVP